MGREWLRVHIFFSVQESAVYRYVFQRSQSARAEKYNAVSPLAMPPHSGLYGLGIVGIHSIGRTEDMFYSKPIGSGLWFPDYRDPARHPAPDKGSGLQRKHPYFIRLFKNSEHLLGSFSKDWRMRVPFSETSVISSTGSCLCGKPFGSCNQEAATEMPQQIAYQFRTLCQETLYQPCGSSSTPMNGYI